MKLYVMRHCERNLNDCSFESPLLPIGLHNAKMAYSNLNCKNINVIYSSPFLRTIQTADFYSKIKNIPINIDYSIAEYISHEDKNKMFSRNDFIIYEEWKREFNLNIDFKSMLKLTYNVNENEWMCINRVFNFLEFLKKKYENTNKNILLVTHMSIVNILLGFDTGKIYKKSFDIDEPYPMGLIIELKSFSK